MRRGLRKTKQVIAGILSAALLMTSIPQNSTYVYASEQAEVQATDEITQVQTETEKISDVQTDSTATEETQLQIEADTNKTGNSENAETEVETSKIQDSEKTKTEEETTKTQGEDKTETEESQDKLKSEEANETQAFTEENTEIGTETQEESSELEETIDSEESEIESETKESETEYENKTDLQEKVVKEELTGVYQFGEFPTDNNSISAYSVNLAVDTNISELEEYLYQQMKERKETIDVESYQISIDKFGSIVSGILNEKADLYFVNKGWSYSYLQSGGSSVVTSVKLTYSNAYDDSAFQKAEKEALTVIKTGMTDLEKAIALHDYLAINCEYDYENYLANKIPDESYTAYGVLVNRTAVCQGYALAYKYLLNKAGINCYMVSSETMNHAWNLIVLNGKYYQVDVTWDDPTWDRIGRVRHEYMFRSDNAFINECNHKDWSVTDGSEVVNYQAVDTIYDSAFWLNCDSPLVLTGEECYYITYDKEKKAGVINKTKLSNITVTGDTICDIGKWTVWGESGWWQNAYSGLFWANNKLYYNDIDSINSITFNDMDSSVDVQEEFSPDTSNGYIYGSALCQGKVVYSLHQSPQISGKESILTADITIETEEPAEKPVEEIVLDQENLILEIGSKASLQATVTPSDATNAVITWSSSDNDVAKVASGIVTAVAAGSCKITAAAGGKEAVCDVTVSEVSDADIASGSYEDITWVIDANGKLTVEGTGNFAETFEPGSFESYYRKAPWYKYRTEIKSANVDVSDMTDTSYMFYECANLVSVELNGFDTGILTNIRSMFRGCNSLLDLDLSGFDTSNVTDMSDVFAYCRNLVKLDLSSFDTSNVTTMALMFCGCNSIMNLDLSSFDTSNVTDMSTMFSGCNSIMNLDLSSFDTSNVTDMSTMFSGCASLLSLDLKNFNTAKVRTMCDKGGGMFDGCSSLTSLDVSSFDTSNVDDEWYGMRFMFCGCSSLTSLDLSSFNTSKVNGMESMFEGCSSLTSLDLSSFDTSKVNNEYGSMQNMFEGCSSLTSLDLSSFNTSTVIDMSNMFKGCSSLTSLDLGNFNTSQVTNMSEMFSGCEELVNLELDNFNTSKVTDMNNMFHGCRSLLRLDLSSFDTSQVTDMTYMFDWCDNLVSLDISNFDTSQVTDMTYMFDWCDNLVSLDISNFDTSQVTDMSRMFYSCGNLTSLDLSSFDTKQLANVDNILTYCSRLTKIHTPYNLTQSVVLPTGNTENMWYHPDGKVITELPRNLDYSIIITKNIQSIGSDENIASGSYENITWVIDANGKLTVEGTGEISNLTGYNRAPWHKYVDYIKLAEVNVTDMTDASYLFSDCKGLLNVDISNFDTSKVTSMSRLFSECISLESIDISHLDTSNVTSMFGMFDGCYSLYSLDVSAFDTSNVISMADMFRGCRSLSNINVNNFDTSKVTNMWDMFSDCRNLSSIDVSNFDTSKVTNMQSMFSNCRNLSSIDVSNFNTSKVTNMQYMFSNCESLSNIDVSNFDTSNVMNMRSMFYNCSSLEQLDVSKFITNEVVDMECMFYKCKNLTSLEVQNFNTQNVTNMNGMFAGCSILEDLDVSGFDTSNVVDMGQMFKDCKNLTSLEMQHFNTQNVTDINSMFAGCNNLAAIDVSGFNTGSVTSIFAMFMDCNALESIDVSSFNTQNVTSASAMFKGCSNLSSVDMSSFDFSNVEESEGELPYSCSNIKAMFQGCINLSEIQTPYNLNFSIKLPKTVGRDVWYDANEIEYTELPKALSYSIELVKNEIPVITEDYIKVIKSKTMYQYGESVEIDDLTVWYYHNDGIVKKLQNSEFTTDASSMDMSTLGNKLLTVTYNNGSKNLTAGVKIKVIYPLEESTITVTLPDEETFDYVYDGKAKKPVPVVTVKDTNVILIQGIDFTLSYNNNVYVGEATDDNAPQVIIKGLNFYSGTVTKNFAIKSKQNKKKVEISGIDIQNSVYNKTAKSPSGVASVKAGNVDVTDKITLVYTYSGTQADGTLYDTTSEAPVNAGNYILTVAVPQDNKNYEGKNEYKFAITKAPLTITARDINICVGAELPKQEAYQYDIVGLIEGDNLITDPTLSCNIKDTTKAETYDIVVSSADAGMNYDITYKNGVLIVDETQEIHYYTVTYNMLGHGEDIINIEVKGGSLLEKPQDPQAKGFKFTGWYKDSKCTIKWDFDIDTVQADTTLYAGWKITNTSDDDDPAQDIPDGIWIAKIKDYTYTGKAIRPSISVYYNKKKLTAGKDYTITYKNNIKAASVDDTKAPTVTVKGKGNYSGTKKATFNIKKIQLTAQENLKAAKIYPIGIKYTPIVIANGNILKSGTDYKLIYKDAAGTVLRKQPTKAGDYQLHITGKGNCEGEIIFLYSVSKSGGANAINKGTATIANYIYGNEEPKVTLSVDGKTLTRDTDYLVSFANTYKKGTATATFIGIGNYTGTIKKNFKVQASAIQPNNIVVAKTASYEKGGAKAEVSVTVNGTELVLGTDYTATYKKNTKLGTASVVIKGKGNYTGSQTKEFKVEPKSLTADGVKIYVSDVLTGKKPAITLYDTNGKKLAANSDYKAEIDKAAHKVTISAGKNGLYKTETPITISYQELEKGKQVTSVALNKKSNTLPKFFEYTGKEIVLEKDWLTVKAGKNILKSDEFEILGYVNNTKKGTATVIIKGCNGYGGIKMLNFKIKARGLF